MSHHLSKPCETLVLSPDFHVILLALASFHSQFTPYTMEGPYTGHLIDSLAFWIEIPTIPANFGLISAYRGNFPKTNWEPISYNLWANL